MNYMSIDLMTNLFSTINFASGIAYGVILVLLSIAITIIAFYFMVRANNIDTKSEMKVSPFAIFLVFLAIGLFLRIIFSLTITGFRSDYNKLVDASNNFANYGFVNYYTTGGTLTPLTYYITSIFGGIPLSFGAKADGLFFQFMIKLPFIICEFGIILMMYFIAKKYYNKYMATVIGCFLSVCPVFCISAIWGSMSALGILFLIITFYFLINKKVFYTHLFYLLSILSCTEAILIYPLICIYFIYSWIKAIRLIKNSHNNFANAMHDKDQSMVLTIPAYALLTFFMFYLISLPMIFKDFNANVFAFIASVIRQPILNVQYFSYNALSIFNIFGKNGIAIAKGFPVWIFCLIFVIIMVGMVVIVYLSKKNRVLLVLLGTFILFTFQTYYLNFTAIATISVLFMLVLSFILSKDRRILKILSVESLAFIINIVVCMASAGYFNNAGAGEFTLTTYTGTPILQSGFGLVVLIICSLLSIICHIYYTIVMLDISMSNHRALFDEKTNNNFLSAMKEIYRF